MSETKFTSGPWLVIDGGSGEVYVRAQRGMVASAPRPLRFDGQDQRYQEEIIEYRANAHLISSAPEMFEALAHIDAYYDMNDLDEREDDDAIEVPVGDLRRARSALKKARGKVE